MLRTSTARRLVARGELPMTFERLLVLRRSLSTQPTAAYKKNHKLQTIRFQQLPAEVERMLEAAAASAFGFGHLVHLLFSRFAEKFGFVIPSRVQNVAFRAFLLPAWKLDCALQGSINVNDIAVDLNISTSDAVLPGFALAPLDSLTLSPDFSEYETYDPSVHAIQPEVGPITILPFTRSPMKVLTRLAKLPRMNRDGIIFDPKSLKPILFAAYPLLVPLYLAEFIEVGGEARRLTAAAFATSSRPAFSIYPSFLNSPSWLPQSDSFTLEISGVAAQDDDAPMLNPSTLSSSLATLQPTVRQLIAESRGSKILEPITSLEKEIEGDVRVMSLSENKETNEEYVVSYFKLLSARAKMRGLMALPDEGKAVIVSKSGLEILSGKEARAAAKKEVAKAEKELKLSKPSWMK